MPDFDDVTYTAKKTVKAASSARTAQVVTVAAASVVGLTVAAPVLASVAVVTGLFSWFGDD